MSDQQTAETSATDATATQQQAADDTKPTETVDFWKTKAREQEKRAKENAEAARKLAEIEDAQKSDAEKAAGKIADLEQQLASATRDALRFKVASKHGIGDDDADLFLTGSDEETLTKQAERLAGRTAEQKKNGNRAPQEGASPSSSAGDDDREFVKNLFGRAQMD